MYEQLPIAKGTQWFGFLCALLPGGCAGAVLDLRTITCIHLIGMVDFNLLRGYSSDNCILWLAQISRFGVAFYFRFCV